MMKDVRPFYWAVSSGDLAAVKHLISSYKVDVNVKTKEGLTPLHRACVKPADLQMIDFLVQAASLEAQDNDGDTPLHHAIYSRDQKAVEFLYSCPADFYVLNKFGQTPAWLMKSYSFSILPEIQISPIAMEYKLRKLLANSFSINMTISFPGQVIKLGRGSSRLGASKVTQLLSTLNSQASKFLTLDEACETLEKGLKRTTSSPEKIAERFRAGKTLFFDTGWQDHAVQVVFINNYMLLTNRGEGRKIASIVPFRINRDKRLSLNAIDKLLDKTLVYQEGKRFLYEELANALSATQNDLICKVMMEECRQSSQKMGNCWWLSPKSAVLAMLMINALLAESKKKTPLFRRKTINLL